MIERLLVSFSGGETSALMTLLLLRNWRDRFNEVLVVFANTGQEREETLEFVHRCDEAFGFGTVWVEARVAPEKGAGTGHTVVTYETASRTGHPFEQFIAKYGIPNQKFPACTRELKKRPIQSYAASKGWSKFTTAIGIRADEPHRRGAKARVVYPLLDWAPFTKPHINTFWEKQPFRLELAGYQGNCKWCWKKSKRKLLTLIDEDPGHFNFPQKMEESYGLVGPEFSKKEVPGYKRTFFRGNQSVADLRAMHAAGGWDRAEDDSVVYLNQRIPLENEDASCTESCEVDFNDQ